MGYVNKLGDSREKVVYWEKGEWCMKSTLKWFTNNKHTWASEWERNELEYLKISELGKNYECFIDYPTVFVQIFCKLIFKNCLICTSIKHFLNYHCMEQLRWRSMAAPFMYIHIHTWTQMHTDYIFWWITQGIIKIMVILWFCREELKLREFFFLKKSFVLEF